MKYKTWTESAVLQGFERDGRTGFIARVQRYPGSGHDWLWLTLFTPKRIYGFIEEHLPAGRDVTRVEAADVGYRVGNEQSPGGGVLQRRGPRDGPTAAVAFTYGKGHVGPRLREGVGEEEISASAVLTPAHVPGASLEGRSEVLGPVAGRLGFRKKSLEISGFGHWHEQHQFTPRFTTPFTYLSLVGEGGGLVAVRSPARSAGFLVRDSVVSKLTKFEISPVREQRLVRVEVEDGGTLELTAADVHRYTLPIQRKQRPSSVVTASIGEMAVVGVINDWMEDQFPAELDPP